MATIQDEVLAAFLKRIADDDAVSSEIVDGLRGFLSGGNLPPPAELVKLIVEGSGDSLT